MKGLRLSLAWSLLPALGTAAWAMPGDAGGAAAQFLRVGAGPRALGMGEAYAAVAEGPEALYWNPAGLAQSQKLEISYARSEFLRYFHHDYVAYAQPIPAWSGTIGLAFTHLSQGSIAGADKDNVATGESRPYSYALAGAFAKAFSFSSEAPVRRRGGAGCRNDAMWLEMRDGCRPSWEEETRQGALMVGLAGKYVREVLFDRSASAVAFDGGALYRPGYLRGSSLAVAFRNVGTKEKFIQESHSLPMELDLGVAYKHSWGDESYLLPALGFSLPYYGAPSGQVGAEYSRLVTPDVRAAVRTGFKSLTVKDLGLLSGFTFGVGVEALSLRIDFACQTYAALGQAFHMGVSWRWGRDPEDDLWRGAR